MSLDPHSAISIAENFPDEVKGLLGVGFCGANGVFGQLILTMITTCLGSGVLLAVDYYTFFHSHWSRQLAMMIIAIFIYGGDTGFACWNVDCGVKRVDLMAMKITLIHIALLIKYWTLHVRFLKTMKEYRAWRKEKKRKAKAKKEGIELDDLPSLRDIGAHFPNANLSAARSGSTEPWELSPNFSPFQEEARSQASSSVLSSGLFPRFFGSPASSVASSAGVWSEMDDDDYFSAREEMSPFASPMDTP